MTMNSMKLPNACPDCGGETREVTLFGRGPENVVSQIAVDSAVVHYAEADAARTWTAMIKPQGSVHTMMCQACGRISMYGVPAAAGK